jgi:hypothetical protein
VWRPFDLPQGLPHASPGAEPNNARGGSIEGCPRAVARSGSARPTGRHTTADAQDRQSNRRWAVERGEVLKAFLQVNPAASVRWCRWQSVGRTSWPISRIQRNHHPIFETGLHASIMILGSRETARPPPAAGESRGMEW